MVFSMLLISGCASGRKQKFEQREKLAASSGLYCDFINGDKNKEVELELNVMMAKKCDSDRPFSITNYKTPAEVTGVLYCCAIKKNDIRPVEMKSSNQILSEPKAEIKSESKAIPAKPIPAASPAKVQSPVDKKPTQPQNNKSNPANDLEEEIVPL